MIIFRERKEKEREGERKIGKWRGRMRAGERKRGREEYHCERERNITVREKHQ